MGHAVIPKAFIEGADLTAPIGEEPKPVSRIKGDAKKVEKELDTGISERGGHRARGRRKRLQRDHVAEVPS